MTQAVRTAFGHRKAVLSDIPVLCAIMDAAIAQLQKGFLSSEQIDASREVMGLDTKLVEDGTYFAILDGEKIVGCGGWSRRATLYGGDHSKGRDPALLDPARDTARVRAMYTHPDYARRGIGKLIMVLCEAEAVAEGFKRFELMATLSGEPLYRAAGYKAVEKTEAISSAGVPVPLIRMEKQAVGTEDEIIGTPVFSRANESRK